VSVHPTPEHARTANRFFEEKAVKSGFPESARAARYCPSSVEIASGKKIHC
jgi:hypothetical protein